MGTTSGKGKPARPGDYGRVLDAPGGAAARENAELRAQTAVREPAGELTAPPPGTGGAVSGSVLLFFNFGGLNAAAMIPVSIVLALSGFALLRRRA